MNIVEQHVLRGPNVYSAQPCVLTVLELETAAQAPAERVDACRRRLLALLPEPRRQHAPDGWPGGSAHPLDADAAPARAVEDVAMALQCLAGATAGFGHTDIAPGAAGRYHVVCGYDIEQVAIDAVELAVRLLRGLLADDAAPAPARPPLEPPLEPSLEPSIEPSLESPLEPPLEPPLELQLADGLAALRATAQRRAIGTSTGAILRAAAARGIPATRITAEANMFALGWGARQKRLQASITGDTGHIAVGIAADKELTKTLLQEAGVPVPEGATARSLEQALRAARRLGGLVTVKPLDGNHGRGVTTRCGTDDEVALAFERAREHGRTIIVERYIQGADHRVLVAGGRVVAAALRRPASVTGDGVSTVRELVEAENRNPARGEGHSNILTRIPLDGHAETALAEQDLQLDSIPAAGRRVALRGNANLSSGGTAEDVTDRLPAQTRAMCVRAARKIGLDVAGIDLVCEDIGVPLDGRNGAVIEINAAPGIRMHVHPSAGTPRDAGAAIVASMFGDGDGRIPLVAVAGAGASAVTLMIEHALRRAGIATGCVTGDGAFVNGHALTRGAGGYWPARTVLAAPEVEFAVLETPHAGILEHGLAFDRCDVAVLLDPGDGAAAADTARTSAVVARTAARALVREAGNRNAAVIGAGIETIHFGSDPTHPALRQHLARGGRAALLEDGALVLAEGESRLRLARVAAVATLYDGNGDGNGEGIGNGDSDGEGTGNGDGGRRLADVLAAAAALMASGLDADIIAAGLRPFLSADAGADRRLPGLDRAEGLDQIAEPVRLGNQFEGIQIGALIVQA